MAFDSSSFQGRSSGNNLQIMNDGSNNIWPTTMGGGVDIIDEATGKIKYLRKNNGLASDTITGIAEDKNGQIWVGMTAGVDAIDIKNGTIKHYNSSQGFRSVFTTGLVFDDKGYLWRNTLAAGIDVVDLKNGRTRNISQSDGLTANIMLAAVEDNYQRMWVGSNNGLNMIDQNAETVHPRVPTRWNQLKGRRCQ